MINCPYQLINAKEEHLKTLKKYEHLYVSDDLVSSRITWDEREVHVDYYRPQDIKVPRWSWFPDKCGMVNGKNKELWEEACAVAYIKKLMPVAPPCRFEVY